MSTSTTFAENFKILEDVSNKLQNNQITDVDAIIHDVKIAVDAYNVVMPTLKKAREELERLKQSINNNSVEDIN